MQDSIEQRLAAVERAVTNEDQDFTALEETATVVADLEDLETDVASLEDRVAELEAATQAIRGYVGNIRSVNREVEQRADAALAAVESLEEAVDSTSSDVQSVSESPHEADHRSDNSSGMPDTACSNETAETAPTIASRPSNTPPDDSMAQSGSGENTVDCNPSGPDSGREQCPYRDNSEDSSYPEWAREGVDSGTLESADRSTDDRFEGTDFQPASRARETIDSARSGEDGGQSVRDLSAESDSHSVLARIRNKL